MKRNILIAALCLVAATGMQAQVLIKHGTNKEKIEFGEDKLVKMVFDTYGESNGNDIFFVRQSGDTLTFDINQVYRLGFAADFTEVEQAKLKSEAAILYDAASATIHIANAKDEKGVIHLFNAEGRLVKSGKGIALSIAELGSGLYIVSYNNVLNAKIVKK